MTTEDGAAGSGKLMPPPMGMKDLTRQHDWAATPLGARNGWPSELRTTVDLMLASGHAMCAMWGPERILLYNDAYAPILGARHPAALGTPTSAVWPELWGEIAPLVDRTFAGESFVFRDQPLVMTRNGFEEQTWYDFAYSPVYDERDEVVGLLNVTSDSTERVLAMRDRDAALARLHESRSRLAALIEANSDSLYSMSADWQEMRHLDGRGFLADTDLPRILWKDAYLFPEDRDQIEQSIAAATRDGKAFELEHRVRRDDGSAGWTFSRAVPLRDAAGQVTEWFGMAADVTARHQAEAALRASEAFMSSVLAASTDCIKVVELDGTLSFMSEGGMRTMEISDFNSVKGCPWPDFLKEEGSSYARAAIEAAKQGRTTHFEAPADTAKGNPRFWSISVSPIFGPDGTVDRILSVSRDHTELERSREQQRFLNSELAHRIKNLMSVVHAIAFQTLAKVADPDAVRAFEDRLSALARSHDVLTGEGWSSSKLDDLMRNVLSTFGIERFSFTGPEVKIGQRAALALSLMLHELSTNAVKYGSLSMPEGKVLVNWAVRLQDGEEHLDFSWTERDGPPAAEPTPRGFGSRVIRMGLTGSGGVDVRYGAQGLTVEASAPLHQVQES